MSKLSNRSKLFLHKLKAQQGLNVPYLDDNYDMNFDYSKPIQPNLQQAQNNKIGYSPSIIQPKNNSGFGNIAEGIGDALPLLSPVLKIGTGIVNLIEGAKEKKKQQAYERNARIDFLKRKEEARANNFYATPYTVGRSDDLTMKKGGLVFQQGGVLDPVNSFTEFYNQQQGIVQQSLDQLQEGYRDKNENLKQLWKQKKSQGISDLVGGGLGAAQYFLQQGGTIQDKQEINQDTLRQKRLRNLSPDQKYSATGHFLKSGNNKSKSKDRFREKQEGGEIDTESLYSKDFQSPYQEESNPMDFIKAENPGEFVQSNPDMYKWLFEEEPQQSYETSNTYFNIYGQDEELPIQPVVDKLEQMGLKPSSINTGEHNVGSAHYEGRGVDLGLNTTFGGDEEKMNQFYQYLTSTEGRKQFPNIKIRDERIRPEGQKVWFNPHIHIELNSYDDIRQ